MSGPAHPEPSGTTWSGTGPMILILGAATVVLMAGLRDIGSLFGPAFLALTLVLSARPLGPWLRRRGVPGPLSVVIVLVVLYVVLLSMLGVLGLAVTQLVNTLPTYADQFSTLSMDVLDWLAAHHVGTEVIADAQGSVNVSTIVRVAEGVFSGLTSGASGIIFLLLSVAFLTIDLTHVSRRLGVLTRDRPTMALALSGFAERVRRYWIVSAVFGVFLAVGDYIALLMLGVPLALTWAIVAFICNFIPNIGFIVALVPPALLALLSHGPSRAVGVIISFVLISFVIQTLLLPKFMGDAVGLNTMTTFVSLVFWTSIIGGLGALLAVPLTIFVKAVIIDTTPSLQWLATFLEHDRDAPPVQPDGTAAPSG